MKSEQIKSKEFISGLITSLLGLIFGMSLVITGSLLTWRSDPVLNIFKLSGIQFHGLTNSDGTITLVLGIVGLIALLSGAIFHNSLHYTLALTCSIVTVLLSLSEICFVLAGSGIVTPGHGLYMILGGAIVGVFTSLCGYSISREKPKKVV